VFEVLENIDPIDEEFIEYLLAQLPVGFIYMTYQDFVHIKNMNAHRKKIVGKISNADINRLELRLKLGEFDKFIKDE